jgi:hypothetical protein
MDFKIAIEDDNTVTAQLDQVEIKAWHESDDIEFVEIEFEEVTIYPNSDTMRKISVQVGSEWKTLKEVVDYMQSEFEGVYQYSKNEINAMRYEAGRK